MGKKQRKMEKTTDTRRKKGKEDEIYYGDSSEDEMERGK